MRKIKVLQILNRFNLGGPTCIASLLTKYLSDEYETLLIGGPNLEDEHDSLYIPHEMGVNPIIVDRMTRSINPLKDITALRSLKKMIKDFNPDIVHTHASKAGALGRDAAYSLKVPVIIHTYHGHIFESYFNTTTSNVYKFVERRLAKKTDAIIALSEKQKYDLLSKHKICKSDIMHVIPIGFELEKFMINKPEKRALFRKKYCVKPDEIAIGIIGRIVPIKNHEMFVNSISKLLQQTDKKIRVFIVGDGTSRHEIEQQLMNNSISFTALPNSSAIVNFTSWQKNIDEVIAGLDIVALTSLNEGTPVSLIEAQAASCPIVSTNVGGIEDVVVKDKTALLSPSCDVDAFVHNLSLLVENESLRQEMSMHGENFVKDRFSYKTMIRNTDELYKSLLAKKGLK